MKKEIKLVYVKGIPAKLSDMFEAHGRAMECAERGELNAAIGWLELITTTAADITVSIQKELGCQVRQCAEKLEGRG